MRHTNCTPLLARSHQVGVDRATVGPASYFDVQAVVVGTRGAACELAV